jgi:hypothetical protein
MMESKETVEKIEKDNGSSLFVPEESPEKEVCWDKPFTLSGGCCQD